jgi:hypothetical protein
MALFGIGKKEPKKEVRKEPRKPSAAPEAAPSGIGSLAAAKGLAYPALWAMCDRYADPSVLDPPVVLFKTLVRIEEVVAEAGDAAVGAEPQAGCAAARPTRDVLDLLLDEISESDRAEAAKVFAVGKVPAGATLYVEGAGDPHVYLVREGRLAMTITPPGGGAPVETGVLGPGDIFGEEVLLGHPARPASVRTMEPCVLLRVEASRIGPFLDRNAGLQQMFEAVRERRVAAAIAKLLGKTGG